MCIDIFRSLWPHGLCLSLLAGSSGWRVKLPFEAVPRGTVKAEAAKKTFVWLLPSAVGVAITAMLRVSARGRGVLLSAVSLRPFALRLSKVAFVRAAPARALGAPVERNLPGSPLTEQAEGSDAELFSLLINQHARAGEPTRAIGLYREMRDRGIAPSSDALLALLIAARLASDPAVVDWAVRELTQSMHAPSMACHVAVLKAYGAHGTVDQAKAWWAKVPAPDARAYQAMIKVLAKARRLEEAALLLTEMQQSGLASDEAYASVLGLLARAGRTDDVKSLLGQMLDEGVHPGVATCNSLYEMLLRSGADASALLERMKSAGVKPNAFTFCQRIHAAAQKHDFAAMRQALEEAVSTGVLPNDALAMTVILCYGRAARHDEALAAFEHLLRSGYRPTARVLSTIAVSAGRARNLQQVERLHAIFVELDARLPRLPRADRSVSAVPTERQGCAVLR